MSKRLSRKVTEARAVAAKTGRATTYTDRITVDGYSVRFSVGAQPGVSVSTADGQWLGWTNERGEPMAHNGHDGGMPTVVRVARCALSRMGVAL